MDYAIVAIHRATYHESFVHERTVNGDDKILFGGKKNKENLIKVNPSNYRLLIDSLDDMFGEVWSFRLISWRRI